MNNITLHAPGTPLDGKALEPGVHAIGRSPSGSPCLLGEDEVGASGALASICIDRRGHWLRVGEGANGVHVNGRPVRRNALLRPGDWVHVEGSAILLTASKPAQAVPAHAGAAAPGDGRTVLRGLGGPHHGRSFTLDRARLIGSAADADIRITGAGVTERHARVSLEPAGVVLRGIAAGDGSTVNGLPVHAALLHPGDQLLFPGGQRLVVEAPMARNDIARVVVAEDAPEANIAHPGERARHRLPWLLLAALLIAAALSALLLL